MKKFLSAIIAMTMIATTFVTSAFAAGEFKVDVTSNKSAGMNEGDTAVVTATLSHGFYAFGLSFDFDRDIFEVAKAPAASSTSTFKGMIEGNDVKCSFAGSENQKAEVEVDVEDPDTGDITTVTKPGVYKIQIRLKAKTDIKTGDYPVNVIVDTAFADGDVVLTPVVTPTTIHVNGTKTDEPTEVKAEFDKDAATKYEYDTVYNYGVGGTVTVPEGKSTTGVTFDISNGTDTHNYNFDFGTSIAANTSFGLNIGNVPKDVTLTFSNLKVK